jgi:small subunit ribosomal protein S4
MARYCGAVCRLCRREGEKLFLKGERCYTNKCAVERREGPPGQHGKGRQAYSDYKTQLRAKQKAKRVYGVLEKQFRGAFDKAARVKGVTGTTLLVNLEKRLDNVVYRIGFAVSRRHARQLVSHGLVLVNGKRVTVASFAVSVGDVVEVAAKSKSSAGIQAALALSQSRVMPDWLLLDREHVKGTVNAMPTREQMPQSINDQLIVELYSK